MFDFKKRRTIIFLLCGVTLLVYANSLFNDFVWDDQEQIVKNTVIQSWSNLPLILTSSTFYAGGAGLNGGFYRPLVSLSYLVNYHLWGLHTFGYHLFQLIIHILNVILVYLLIDLILAKQKIRNRGSCAFFAALLFAVHPANVESVSYVASVGETMYAFFLLFAFYKLLKGKDFTGRNIGYGTLFAFFAIILLGFFAKETEVVILASAPLYLWIFERPKLSGYARFFAGAGIVVGIYAFLRVFVAKILAEPSGYSPISHASFFERLLTIPYEIVSYLALIFYPRDLSISRHFVVHSVADIFFWGALMMLAMVGVVIFLIYRKTKSRLFLFFILWFFVSLAPELNLIPVSMTMAERWLYVPIIGVCAAASLGGVLLAGKAHGKWRYAVYGIMLVAVFALGARTIMRNRDWGTEMTLFAHDTAIVSRVSPQGSFDLENNYGVQLVGAGRIDEGEKHLRASIMLNPDSPFAQNNLGVVLQRKSDLAGALAQYEKAISISDYYLAYENKGDVLVQMGSTDDAKKFYEQALQKFPDNEHMELQLAQIYANSAEDKDKAKSLLYRVINSDPKNDDANRLLKLLESD